MVKGNCYRGTIFFVNFLNSSQESHGYKKYKSPLFIKMNATNCIKATDCHLMTLMNFEDLIFKQINKPLPISSINHYLYAKLSIEQKCTTFYVHFIVTITKPIHLLLAFKLT